jgi:hypothetical protein
MALVKHSHRDLTLVCTAAKSYKPGFQPNGMPALMMRTYPGVWRHSVTLLFCFGISGCELAKRDFADSPSSETSTDGGASGSEVATSTANGENSGETNGETGGATGELTADVEATTGGDATNVSPPDDESSAPSGATEGNPGGSSEPPPGDTTGASGDTAPEPGDTSAAGQGSSNGEQTTGSLCDQNILVNGNFEAGDDGWTPSSNYSAFEQRVHPLVVANGHESLANYAVTAHDGTQFGFLGDVPDDQYDRFHTTLTQSVFIPEEATGIALVGYVWISSDEVDGEVWDIARIQLESQENSNDYWLFKDWNNLDSSDDWVKFDAYLDVVDGIRGKHVNLLIQAETDQATPTRFWFDEVELVVVCP